MVKIGDIYEYQWTTVEGKMYHDFYEVVQKFGSSCYIKHLENGKIEKTETRHLLQGFKKVNKKVAKALYGRH